MIIQVSRMRDGTRRVTSVVEVIGMEGDVITLQDLFTYEYEGESADGRLIGKFVGVRPAPHCLTKAQYFGLDVRCWRLWHELARQHPQAGQPPLDDPDWPGGRLAWRVLLRSVGLGGLGTQAQTGKPDQPKPRDKSRR